MQWQSVMQCQAVEQCQAQRMQTQQQALHICGVVKMRYAFSCCSAVACSLRLAGGGRRVVSGEQVLPNGRPRGSIERHKLHNVLCVDALLLPSPRSGPGSGHLPPHIELSSSSVAAAAALLDPRAFFLSI